MTTLTLTDILLFTNSPTGSGRDENDKRNKQREHILIELYHGRCESFYSDTQYGGAWKELNQAFLTALKEISILEGLDGVTLTKVIQRGGRKFNYDFLVTFQTASSSKDVCVEFKFGGISVDTLPEFFNPAADKPFHPILYASFFYKNYLSKIANLYNIIQPLPTEEEYMKAIHKNEPTIPFLKAIDEAERADTDRSIESKYKQKQKIAAQSISEYLEQVIFNTNFKLIESELKRSQLNKRFLIYSNGKFHHDLVKPTELELEETAYVKNNNTLVIQTKEPSTRIEMLLRWKNHLGVLFPAWQISMCRK